MSSRVSSVLATIFGAAFVIGCGSNKPAATESAAPKSPAAKTRVSAPLKEDPHWGYEGAEGPAAWGKLSAKWAVCAEGRSQSPIDIGKALPADVPALRAEFRPAELKIVHHEHMADIVNTGHSIQVNYTEGDTLKIGVEEFELIQYHFHSPSEHTIAGKHFPMEMHMVHKSAGGKLAVVSVLIEEGAANPVFEGVGANLPASKSTEYHLEHVRVDVNQLLPKNTGSYRYTGSLTTPPCSEGVKWVVMRTPVSMSGQQIDAFRSVMKGNNRPTQPLNGRTVVSDRVTETAAK